MTSADVLADRIKMEIARRIHRRDEQHYVFTSARLSDDLNMPVNQFNAGLRQLRTREDALLDIERWNGQTCNSPWEARLTKRLAADGGATMLSGHDGCPQCDRQVSTDFEFCPSCGTGLYDPTLEFVSEYVQPIADGDKTATVRYGVDGHRIDVGDTVALEAESGKTIALAEVRRVAEVNAVEALATINLFDAAYPIDDVDDLIEGINQHYDEQITPSSTVRVITWRLVRDREGVANA